MSYLSGNTSFPESKAVSVSHPLPISINFACIGTASIFNFVFWHSNHKVNAFFTPTWVWEVIPDPVAVFPFVHFVWPYENTVIAKAIRLRPCWESFQNTFQNLPQSCVWCGSVISLLSNHNTEGVHNGLCTLWFICNLLTPVNLAGKTVFSRTEYGINEGYGSLKILQCRTPNYLSPYADHSKNNAGIEISWHSSYNRIIHTQIASSHIYKMISLFHPFLFYSHYLLGLRIGTGAASS